MADHIREQIMDAIVTRLTGLTTTGTNVYRLRTYPQETAGLPSLNILQGSDEPIDADTTSHDYVDRELVITVEARVKSSSTQVDQTLNQIAKEVTVALMADRTQGVSGVIDTTEDITTEPDTSGESEIRTAMMAMTFIIYYRTSRTDPST